MTTKTIAFAPKVLGGEHRYEARIMLFEETGKHELKHLGDRLVGGHFSTFEDALRMAIEFGREYVARRNSVTSGTG